MDTQLRLKSAWVVVVRIKTLYILGYICVQNASGEDSDQTAGMQRLIRIFDGRIFSKVRFLTQRALNVFFRYM